MHINNKFKISLSLLFSVLVISCHAEINTEDLLRTLVSGSFTAGGDYESGDDLSGINIFIVDRSSEPVDTLYRAVTDVAGNFASEAAFSNKGEYPILVMKDNRNLDAFTLVLAEGDPVRIESRLPDLRANRVIKSNENEALRTYRRLDNQYYRTVNLINAGAVEEDEIPDLINTWADLFWSIRQDYPQTLAADRSTRKSLEILEGWDDQKTLERINTDHTDENLQEAAIYYGTIATIRLEGLDSSISFLDELDDRIQDQANKRLVAMNKVEILYDSLRVDQARQAFEQYESRFHNSPDSLWASKMRYELNNLAPGMLVPDFELRTSQQGTVSSESLKGSPYLIEVVELTSRQYQGSHSALIQMAETFSDQNLKLITVPLEHSSITINAFYDERPEPWAVAVSRAYEDADLIELFNISQLPTRVLVDGDGKIVRKFIGTNLQQIASDIETLMKINSL